MILQRKTLSLRLSVTDRCQLRCRYCMPVSGVEWHHPKRILSYEEMTRFVALLQQTYQLQKVRLTGGDPLVRKNLAHLVKSLKALEIPDISLTTNAQALAQQAPELVAAGLGRVNISLDSLNPETYTQLTCGGSVERAVAGIRAARDNGLTPVKLNMVVMRGVNDSELESMLGFALDNNCELRFLELMPIGWQWQNHAESFVSSDEVKQHLENLGELTPLTGSCAQSSRDFSIRTASGRCGRVGLISSSSAPFCTGCRRVRLTCTGELIGCLTSGDSRFVRPLLKPEAEHASEVLAAEVEAALKDKGKKHTFNDRRPMIQVGG